ncbi:hypothetical protein BBBOND_0212250 [Babesia bigemina]|uniref:Uncharacterized protein n=1 Tax=Babesia bigemina TaxID=5866 RepID=A0A061D6A1_BABBI|nr:hypothetical protein BBBOND_0212250 [Babesia bigemina]CDR96083.1 hypothetical protein BBBOND_0212250 [Babesia bigemina]|eukprot:XP_012768269.1 hypothetical protein BBBOND_0212250 [Babesia bigemina]
MAEMEGSTSCCGCGQPCHVKEGSLCCPKDCKRCEIKKCKEKQECECNDCNCGCKSAIKEGKQCKDSGCPSCVSLCKSVKVGEKCKCSICGCGCEGAFKQNKRCTDQDKPCDMCQKRCKNLEPGEECICNLCNCGCNGVNCQCCRWCNPDTTCGEHGDCDSEEIHDTNCPRGKCQQTPGDCSKVTCMCEKMGIDKRAGLCECLCKCGNQCPRILCDQKRGGVFNGQRGICSKSTKDTCTCECECNCNACGKYYGKDGKQVAVGGNDQMHSYVIGKCRFKCTNCGRLCDQDRCMIWIRVVVIGLIILASLFVMRAIFPEKFRAIMTKIRAAFASSPVHSGRSPSNLVGDRIPEESHIDRYSVISPGTYPGLS